MKAAARRLLMILLVAAAFSCCNYERLSLSDPPPIATLSAPPPGNPRAERVIVISIDGLRPDAIETHAPAIRKLRARGAACPRAETIRPSVTLPSHTSMLTGLDFARHGVVWNNYRTGYLVHPSVFSVLAQSGKKSAMLFSKDKFHFLANPNCVSWVYGPPTPAKVPASEDLSDPEELKKMLKQEEDPNRKLPPGDPSTTADMLGKAFSSSWPKQQWPLTFVHFREVDEAGHRKGWMGPEYLEAVKTVDQAVAAIVDAIDRNGGFEKTALILSADHGGSGKGHYRWTDPDRVENITIPWICVGPGVPSGLTINRILHTYDTAPTALGFLGLGAPTGIDGKPVDEVLK